MSPNEDMPNPAPVAPIADTAAAESLPTEALDKVAGGLFNTANDYVNGSGTLFGTGGSSYSPGTSSGYNLASHELTHTVQQRPVP